MKKLFIFGLAVALLSACGNDPVTTAGYFDDDVDKSNTTTDNSTSAGVQNFNNTGNGNMEVNIYNQPNQPATVMYEPVNYGNPTNPSKSVFTKDLTYVGMFKTSNGVNLVMKNNTSYKMYVNVNVSLSCLINDRKSDTYSKTLYFAFDKYEQKELSASAYWYGGLTTIECTGSILSIIATSSDPSNFQDWTGSYPISTN